LLGFRQKGLDLTNDGTDVIKARLVLQFADYFRRAASTQSAAL
jgi:hypothetical protein